MDGRRLRLWNMEREKPLSWIIRAGFIQRVHFRLAEICSKNSERKSNESDFLTNEVMIRFLSQFDLWHKCMAYNHNYLSFFESHTLHSPMFYVLNLWRSPKNSRSSLQKHLLTSNKKGTYEKGPMTIKAWPCSLWLERKSVQCCFFFDIRKMKHV